jgi:hypothetical protein
MAKANCSSCGGEINTESSPTGKCVRCLEAERRQVPLSLPESPVALLAELPLSAATEQIPVPGGTVHYARAAGRDYAAMVPDNDPPEPTPVTTQEAFAEPAIEGAHGEHVGADQAADKGEEDPL